MFKKVLYVIASLILGFLVYYISWISTTSDYIVKVASKAADEKNDVFFLKWYSFYEEDAKYSFSYVNGESTADLKVYRVYHEKNEDTMYSFFFTNLEGDFSFDSKAANKDSKLIITSGTKEYEVKTSTFGYDSIPLLQIDVVFTSMSAHLGVVDDKGTESTDDDEITTDVSSIDKIVLKDAKDKIIFSVEGSEIFNVNDSTIEEWKSEVEAETAFKGYSSSELKKQFYYHYPTMWKVWRNLIIYVVVDVALGLFFFWPRKNKFEKLSKSVSIDSSDNN